MRNPKWSLTPSEPAPEAPLADDNIKNVFISHVHEDDDGLGKTKELLTKNGMTIRDGSINSDKPNEAKSPDYIK